MSHCAVVVGGYQKSDQVLKGQVWPDVVCNTGSECGSPRRRACVDPRCVFPRAQTSRAQFPHVPSVCCGQNTKFTLCSAVL